MQTLFGEGMENHVIILGQQSPEQGGGRTGICEKTALLTWGAPPPPDPRGPRASRPGGREGQVYRRVVHVKGSAGSPNG